MNNDEIIAELNRLWEMLYAREPGKAIAWGHGVGVICDEKIAQVQHEPR